jgi:hypothetical protein
MEMSVPATRDADAKGVAWRVVLAVGGGALVGALVGGIGGRLVMLVLRLGSDDALLGARTDDGFEIGVFTTSTFFLLQVTAGLGGATGLTYLVCRSALPRVGRALVWGVFVALVVGANNLAPDSFDFSALDPKSFAVGSFVVLPGIAAFLIALFIERLLRVEPWSNRLLTGFLGICAMPLAPAAPVILFVGGTLYFLRRRPGLAAMVGRLGRIVVPLAISVLAVRGGLEIWTDAHLIID